MTSFENFIEELKSKVDLAAEINKTPSFALQDQRRGKYVYGVPTAAGGPGDSLMVDISRQTYTYWKHGGNQGNKGLAYGDVFDWLTTYRKMGFMEALKYLCREYKVEIPDDLQKEPTQEQLSFRVRAQAWDVVTTWLSERLFDTPAALDYVRGRGWTDETIKRARLGFSLGSSDEAARDDLLGELAMHGFDPLSPKIVAIVGHTGSKGELREWARQYHVDIDQHPNWLKKGRIFGLLDFPRLVYPHITHGQVAYFSCRNLEQKKEKLVGVSGKYKTWNLPAALVGRRHFYFNDEYYPKADRVVVVEGPADAITWGQWGFASVSLIGLGSDDDLLNQIRNHETVFLGMDNGEEGRKSIDKLGPQIGPNCWVLHYPTEGHGEDTNAWLQYMIDFGSVDGRDDVESQKVQAENLLGKAELFALRFARKAALTKGPEKVRAIEEASKLISQLDSNVLSQYHKPLRDILGFGTREFDRVLRSLVKEEKKDLDVVVTLGGLIHGWFLEYCYDPSTDQARLAYRSPDGEIGISDDLVIEGKRYIPEPPDPMVRTGTVLFPQTIGERIPTIDLVEEIEEFINQYYILDTQYLSKIIAYYILLTWIYDAFKALPYLRAMGDFGSGKSEMMRRVGHICYRLYTASGANTSATFFRTHQMYKGTTFIDESDLHDGGDMTNDIIKFLNLGSMEGNYITRMTETLDYYGNKVLKPMPYPTFGPKLIAMRKDFKDKATGSRCLTIQVVGKSAEELVDKNVPFQINEAFETGATILRNKLLRWRLENFSGEKYELTNDLVDINLSARLNQVTMAVKALAKIADDEELMNEITRFLRAFAKDEVRERSLTMQAYVVEALWGLWKEEETRELYMKHGLDGRDYFWMHDVRKRANDILDSINEAGSSREVGEGKEKAELTPQGMSHYLREDLRIEVGKRQGPGVPVYWDLKKMIRLGKKYGVLEPDFEITEKEENEPDV